MRWFEDGGTRAVLWEKRGCDVLVDDDDTESLIRRVGQDERLIESAELNTNDWLVTSSVLLLWT